MCQHDIPWDMIDVFIHELIKGMKTGVHMTKEKAAWPLAYIQEKLIMIAAERNVFSIQVNPAYTSQQCLACGSIDKANRKREIDPEKFLCEKCEYEMHADHLGANNILWRGVYSPAYRQISLNLQKCMI